MFNLQKLTSIMIFQVMFYHVFITFYPWRPWNLQDPLVLWPLGCALEPLEAERRCTGMPICGRTWGYHGHSWMWNNVKCAWASIILTKHDQTAAWASNHNTFHEILSICLRPNDRSWRAPRCGKPCGTECDFTGTVTCQLQHFQKMILARCTNQGP